VCEAGHAGVRDLTVATDFPDIRFMARRKKKRNSPRQQNTSRALASSKPFWRGWWFLASIGLVVVGSVVWQMRPKEKATVVAVNPLPTLAEILTMAPEQLENVDIAVMNLRCAEGLRGSEKLNVPASLKTLDRFAEHVSSETIRNYHKYKETPEDFQYSEAYYRLLILAVVLQEDFGVRYNRRWIAAPETVDPNDEFYSDSQNVFVHSLTDAPMMGTCASMPVLYVAVGRRLGYPLHLVSTKGHLFARWDDGQTRLNIEGTTESGLGSRRAKHSPHSWPCAPIV
jgi:hypothetical protein